MVQKEMSNKYLRTQVESATPGMLILMLYDGAIRFLNTYKHKVDANSFADAFNNKMKAQNIIYELSASLDMEVGEISHNLYRVYDYIMDKLISVDVLAKDVESVDEVIGLLSDLRDAWKDVIDQPVEQAASLSSGNVYA